MAISGWPGESIFSGTSVVHGWPVNQPPADHVADLCASRSVGRCVGTDQPLALLYQPVQVSVRVLERGRSSSVSWSSCVVIRRGVHQHDRVKRL